MAFPGGSAWAMARDICAGHVLVNERTFRRMRVSEVDKVRFEMNRLLTSIRGSQPSLDDIEALRDRNRQIQKIVSALRVLDFHLQATRK